MNASYPELLSDLNYTCYRFNRNRSPNISPEGWSKIFPKWNELEDAYQHEIALTYPVISKLEDIARANNAKWFMTANGFLIKLPANVYCFVVEDEIAAALKDDYIITCHPASKTITVRAVVKEEAYATA